MLLVNEHHIHVVNMVCVYRLQIFDKPCSSSHVVTTPDSELNLFHTEGICAGILLSMPLEVSMSTSKGVSYIHILSF